MKKWHKLNSDHDFFKHSRKDILGVVYAIVEDKQNGDYEEWYNMRGDSWVGIKTSPSSIKYWNDFGFKECTEEQAKETLKQ